MKRLSLFILLALILALLPATVIAAPPAQGEGTAYTIQADDWLSKLADKQYGDPLAYPAIVYYTNLKATEDGSFAEIDNQT